ncbi:MAG: hypothetical protein KOO62_12390 [candidate division Zixibacteria bacterium]|nr:hypothetical protein [candidate division Zixibacteria bacterium]
MQKRSRKKKKPDVNELAAGIVDQATNEDPPEEEPEVDDGKNPAAVALGRLGGLKGGKARAKKLTAEERRRSARKAALARWRKSP